MNTIARYVDDRRVQLHLRLAELQLRQRNTSSLPQSQQQTRMRQLDALRRYWQQAIFPHNVDHKQRAPIFIDPDGRVCAVAHLVIQSGHTDVAQRIHLATNDAYVRDMPFAELDQWAQANGLTREELARIQPTYEPTVSDPAAFAALMSTVDNFIRIAGLGILIGLWLFLRNLYSLLRQINTLRWAIQLTTAGVVISSFAYFILRDLLNSMDVMLNHMGGISISPDSDGIMFVPAMGYGSRFQDAARLTELFFLIGAAFAFLGLMSLGAQYAVRLKNRGSKVLAIS